MDISGHDLFVAMSGLAIFDITDPSTPVLLNSPDPSMWFSEDVAVSGNMAYVGNWTNGALQAIDVSNLTAPRVVGSLRTREGAHNVALQADYCYVTDYDCSESCAIDRSQFLVIDVSNPTPIHITSFAGAIQNSGVLLTWRAVDISEVAGFQIERSEEGQTDFVRVNTKNILPAGPYRFLDQDVRPGINYSYRLKSLDRLGQTETLATTSIVYSPRMLPNLSPAHPNPLAGSDYAVTRYSLASSGPVAIRVLNARGQLVRNLMSGNADAGEHEVIWDGRDDRDAPVAGGVYVLVLEAAGTSLSQRIIRLP